MKRASLLVLCLLLLELASLGNANPVYAASISINPTNGPVGTNVAVTGSGFNTDAQIYFSYTENLDDGGANLGFCPTSSGSIRCSFTVPSDAQLGTHHVVATTHNTVQGLVSADALFSVTSTPPPQSGTFAISVSKTSINVAPGGSDAVTVTVSLISGTPPTVTLSLSGLPSGVTYSFSPQSGTPTFASTLAVTASAGAPPGTYSLTITGTGGGNSATSVVSLAISQGFGFSVSASPGTATVTAGNAAQYSVSVTLTSGTPQLVTLTSVTPAGVTASFSQSSGNPTFSSILTLTTSLSGTPGTYTLNVVGTGGGMTSTSQIVLIVQARSTTSTTSVSTTVTTSRSASTTTSIAPSTTTTTTGPVCGATDVSGAFEPSQGVWQDDELFADQPGKQLLKLDASHYSAQLPMVVGKPTLLFGVKGSRGTIELSATLHGSNTSPAIVRFMVADAAGNDVVYSYDAGSLQMMAPCTQSTQVRIDIPVPTGVPAAPFEFTGEGGYSITMELAGADGAAVGGSQVVVNGNVVGVPGLKVYFLPVSLSTASSSVLTKLAADATSLALNLAIYSPNYLPVASGTIRVAARPSTADWTDLAPAARSFCRQVLSKTGVNDPDCAASALLELATNRATDAAWLQGIDRIVLVLSQDDFHKFDANDTAVAFTISSKVIFARQTDDHWDIAHELAHTLPSFPWLGDTEVFAGLTIPGNACGQGYHNTGTFGNGFRIMNGGIQARTIENQVGGLMGPDSPDKNYWIEQCTYWHLMTALHLKADPAVTGISGWIIRYGGGEVGGFNAGFSLTGAPDLSTTSIGNYSLVFGDSAGGTLATYRFNATYSNEDGVRLNLNYFSFRLQIPNGASTVKLVSPAGVLASMGIASSPPSVTFVSPSGGASIDVSKTTFSASWTASADATSFSVFVSPDNGENWHTILLDSNATRVVIPTDLLGNSTNLLKVVASNGFQSSNSTLAIAVGRPSPFSWAAIGIPAAAVLAIVLISLVVIVAFRRRKPVGVQGFGSEKSMGPDSTLRIEPSAQQDKFCTDCGMPTAAGERFCRRCGTSISS